MRAISRAARWVVRAADAVLRWRAGITDFEANDDGLLRIERRRVRRRFVLADGAIMEPGDRIVELHIWNEHFPPFIARHGDFRWASKVQGRMRASLCRLARHIASDAGPYQAQALRMRPHAPKHRPVNALARLMLAAGFERVGPVPSRSRVVEFLDSFWMFCLTWTYNPLAVANWSFGRTRHEFWVSRSRFLALYGDGSRT